LSRDEQSEHLNLALDDDEGATLQQLQGHSIMYRIAHGAAGGAQSAHRANNVKKSQLGEYAVLAIF